ncbi:hypothetical protein Q0Z83_022730 [Actinoplanes sichuanensis]|uniref:Vitamin K epoxide reductase family protein n=1 Tax=Actinoplanes sichuanensis TaxID=512349 RepID=A0ABW4AI21_9ACTN|nr:hypothetical protein [Actinoplanes sichuanensis]BEL04082.1 hypothetical protein Q0Z83_022730 [Actinoplanes sichuanensis]
MRTDQRHGDLGEVSAYLGIFFVLFCLAVYTLFSSAFLFSNACIGPDGQLPICPANGPDWARPLPVYATIIGTLIGLGGLLYGRPVRTPALALGYLLTVGALIGIRLLASPG